MGMNLNSFPLSNLFKIDAKHKALQGTKVGCTNKTYPIHRFDRN